MIDKEKKYFRSGLGLRKEIGEVISAEFSAEVIEFLKDNDYKIKIDRLEFSLAREFGFCYGVERAVNYSYQIFKKFPEKRVFITGEVIHNPQVNQKLLDMGVRFLSGPNQGENKREDIGLEDVIVLPAFGVPVKDLDFYRETGCTIVDTTCGSVIVVWKNVEKYAQQGYTAVVHGKWHHEETRATCSQTGKYKDGHFLVLLNLKEAEEVREYIRGNRTKKEFLELFKDAVSPGFDPDIHLQKIGIANQTTMLMTETAELSTFLKSAYEEKFGAEKINDHFMAMDTICSATQERQDALNMLVDEENADLFVVIGGFNSSNTVNLANIARSSGRPAYHIRGPEDILSPEEITCLPGLKRDVIVRKNWLPEGEIKIGITAGASTPNSVVGKTIEAIVEAAGLSGELSSLLGKEKSK